MSETLDLSDCYTIQKTAEILSVTPAHVTHMLREGRLKGRRIGKAAWLVSKKSLEEYLEALKRVRGEG